MRFLRVRIFTVGADVFGAQMTPTNHGRVFATVHNMAVHNIHHANMCGKIKSFIVRYIHNIN